MGCRSDPAAFLIKERISLYFPYNSALFLSCSSAAGKRYLIRQNITGRTLQAWNKEEIMNQNILETKCLAKSFRGHYAVDHISLAVPKCCVYGLLGPNGAGKSTLLKMMTGILRPTDGEILFDGHPWSRKDLADIGALIETPPVYENLTAWENLKVRALMLHIPDERIREVLELVDLTDTGKKRAGAFSLGMKQRLGIAIALLNRPKLLVLDEPVNGLDPIGIQELRQMIRRFPEEGITVIVSSHILSEIAQTADHIGIIANGALGYQGGMPEIGHLEELFMQVAAKYAVSDKGRQLKEVG